jgi:hypothetical protein
MEPRRKLETADIFCKNVGLLFQARSTIRPTSDAFPRISTTRGSEAVAQTSLGIEGLPELRLLASLFLKDRHLLTASMTDSKKTAYGAAASDTDFRKTWDRAEYEAQAKKE